jgi:hypothetical protein
LLSAQKLRFGWLVAARWLTLPAGELGPQDADIIRGVDADPNPVAFDLDYGDGDGDAVADDYLLAGLPAQNQHVTPLEVGIGSYRPADGSASFKAKCVPRPSTAGVAEKSMRAPSFHQTLSVFRFQSHTASLVAWVTIR